MKKNILLTAFLIGLLSYAVPTKIYSQFAKGADVGWLSQMEASGRKFYNNNGTQQDCLDILKGKGINSIRLRVWVNPANGWCNKNDVVNMAKRAKNKGFRIMIDFHYSDSWADPGKQTKPAAWRTKSFNDLMKAVYDHTYDVMNTLKANGVYPEWVQVGNETNNGMLWEEGRASANMRNFAWFINCGYDAVKAVNSSTKVIVHLSNGYDNGLFRWMFDGLRNNGAKWDIIGMSLYPTTSDWSSKNTQCLNNMRDMINRYGKSIMISEVGMDVSAASTCRSFLTDIMNKVKSLANGRGLGVFYWEPQSYGNWQGYTKGAFGTNGRPTVAMDAFQNFSATSVAAASLSAEILNAEEGVFEKSTTKIAVYPNPVSDRLTINLPAHLNQEADIQIYTEKGHRLIAGKISSSANTMDVSSLLPGSYILRIKGSKHEKVMRFKKE